MQVVYDKNSLKARLETSKKLYCSNDLSFGLRLLPAKYAINYKYIQANNDKAIMFLVIDLDHNNPLIFEEVGLPAPNFITISDTGTSHYCYVLSYPIFKDYAENAKALTYFAKIQQAYTNALKGDCQYVGLVMKNPLSENWKVWNVNHFYTYDLYELADYVELPKTITKKEAIGEGRNCFLFDTVRKWAYKEVLFYKSNGATLTDFYNVILNKLEKSNIFNKAPSLNFNELKAIAKSISKFCWKNFTIEKFSKIQSNRAKKPRKLNNIVKQDFKNELTK